MTIVTNLSTGEKREYSCDSRSAVIAAYAQEKGDWNTWDYESNYGDQVVLAYRFYNLGDWATVAPDAVLDTNRLQSNIDAEEVLKDPKNYLQVAKYIKKQAQTPQVLTVTLKQTNRTTIN
jgi:hypothetical protein